MIYTPKHFEASNEPALIAQLVDRYNFATLIAVDSGSPVVSHIPFVFRPEEGPYGTLVGHIATANPQGEMFKASQEVMVIFQGPHAYISSSWYAEQAGDVPTWNYPVVHMSGVPEIIAEHDAAFSEMLALIQHNDPELKLSLSDDDRRGFLKAITVFKINVSKVSAKFKMSQNRSAEDHRRVVEQLSKGGESQAATAQLMSMLGQKK